ncbi:unnamed protein product, partial [marine sediment metagenome]
VVLTIAVVILAGLLRTVALSGVLCSSTVDMRPSCLILEEEPNSNIEVTSSKGMFPQLLIDGEYYYIHWVEEGEYNNGPLVSLYTEDGR